MMHTLWQNISSKHSARLFSTCSLSRTILNQTWDKREPNIYRGRNFNYNFTYIHKYIYRYILWWYCSWFAIGLAYRQPIVENSLKISLKISWQFLWQSILPHLLPQKMIVNISLKFRQRFRCFNSSLTKFQRSFGRNFGDFFCGEMLWQNVLPQGKFSSKRERERNFALWQNVWPQLLPQKKNRRNFVNDFFASIQVLTESWRNSDEKKCGKILWQNVLPQSTRRKVWRNSDEIKTKETTKKILIPESIASGRKSWWSSITTYIHICLDTYIHAYMYT